jgi:hypothetical protein
MSSLTTTRLAASQFALLTSIFALSGSLVSGVSGYFSLTGLRALFHRDVPYRLQWRSFAGGSGGRRERPRKRQTAAKSSPIETSAAIAERRAAWRLYASSSHKRCEEPTTRRRVLACLGNSGFAQAFVLPALAATAQAIYGGIAVGTMTAIITLESGPFYGALGPRAFWVMALLCAAALPIAFAMRGISINASGSNPIQPAPR